MRRGATARAEMTEAGPLAEMDGACGFVYGVLSPTAGTAEGGRIRSERSSLELASARRTRVMVGHPKLHLSAGGMVALALRRGVGK